MGLFSSNKKSDTNTKGKNKKDNPLNVPKTVQKVTSLRFIRYLI